MCWSGKAHGNVPRGMFDGIGWIDLFDVSLVVQRSLSGLFFSLANKSYSGNLLVTRRQAVLIV